MKRFKITALLGFMVIAALALAFSGDDSAAQTKKSSDKNAQTLASIADYKSWRQITKQEPLMGLTKSASTTEPTFIPDSTAMG